ncbi:MAG: TetR/AcrR family transcriptional regulator [Caulobacteraceae bacterium]
MKPKPAIALKKLPKQGRSLATVAALVEAATYILRAEGPSGYTANKVAEKAGVNIASFYQYYPNKEALLFHIIRKTWDQQFERLTPILTRPGADHAVKLHEFIRQFFIIEAAEADLRGALRAASIELKGTEEFQTLIAQGTGIFRTFIANAVTLQPGYDLEFSVRFTVLLVTSFAERTTDEGTSGEELIRQAELLADMLVAQLGIP